MKCEQFFSFRFPCICLSCKAAINHIHISAIRSFFLIVSLCDSFQVIIFCRASDRIAVNQEAKRNGLQVAPLFDFCCLSRCSGREALRNDSLND